MSGITPSIILNRERLFSTGINPSICPRTDTLYTARIPTYYVVPSTVNLANNNIYSKEAYGLRQKGYVLILLLLLLLLELNSLL